MVTSCKNYDPQVLEVLLGETIEEGVLSSPANRATLATPIKPAYRETRATLATPMTENHTQLLQLINPVRCKHKKMFTGEITSPEICSYADYASSDWAIIDSTGKIDYTPATTTRILYTDNIAEVSPHFSGILPSTTNYRKASVIIVPLPLSWDRFIYTDDKNYKFFIPPIPSLIYNSFTHSRDCLST